MTIFNPSKLLTRSLMGAVGLSAIAFLSVPKSAKAQAFMVGAEVQTLVKDNVMTGEPYVSGALGMFNTEMEMLNLDPINIMLPDGTPKTVLVREDHDKVSPGKTTICQIQLGLDPMDLCFTNDPNDPNLGRYKIDSYFDIFIETSFDDGIWFDSMGSSRVILADGLGSPPGIITDSPLLPPNQGSYISPDNFHNMLWAAIKGVEGTVDGVIIDIDHKNFVDVQRIPVPGVGEREIFNSDVEGGFQLEIKPPDFGDAPDTPQGFNYKTLLASDGPRYDEGDAQRLGRKWDGEPDGQPTIPANGDDISLLGGFPAPVDDEDGVIFGDSFVDIIFNITRPGPHNYNIRAWWDIDKDRCFDHQGEVGFDDMCPGMESELFIDDNLLLGPGIPPIDPEVIVLAPDLFQKRYELDFDPRDFYSRFRLTCDPVGDVPPFTEVSSTEDCNTFPQEEMLVGEIVISHGEVEDYPMAVPEPSTTLGLLFLGLGSVVGLKRKDKAKK
ncbi:MAG: PEP-CTERM sorting domain-containing protein [Crocosphaera sp.]|nr:PEP-CTERM sorting domain-containing protein [Crocosphaera sp.]